MLAALVADGPEPTLLWWVLPRTLTSEDLLVFLREALPQGAGPRVVVLDNASLPTSRAIRAARPALTEQGIILEYLPPHSPELNRIAPLFGVIKHHDLPERSYPNLYALYLAVTAAFEPAEQRLLAQPRPLASDVQQLRQAA